MHLLPPLPYPDIPVSGHLKFFKSEWFKLTKDPKLIQMVSACPINLIKEPTPTHSHPISMSSTQRNAARAHIHKLLAKNVIIECEREEGDFISSVFLVPIKDGGFRLILNLKPIQQICGTHPLQNGNTATHLMPHN